MYVERMAAERGVDAALGIQLPNEVCTADKIIFKRTNVHYKNCCCYVALGRERSGMQQTNHEKKEKAKIPPLQTCKDVLY